MGATWTIHGFLAASAWYLVNGALHDIFVIRAHQGPYNRELLRLLMDGHVLLFSGVVCLVGWHMLRSGLVYGPLIGLIVAVGMVVYCLLIFPFLKSFVTLGISIFLAVVSVQAWLVLKN